MISKSDQLLVSFRSLRRFASAVQRKREEFRPVIGLEVHVQIRLRSKLFSSGMTGEEAGPNSRVAPFDMAMPGTLPVLNRQAVMHALRMAHLLNCEIPTSCRFDRKHYFYADMPAGYQITQSDRPIAKNGHFGFHVYGENMESYWKEVDIIQLQLEQDSGKTIHHGNTSLIDLNRAGMALVEVVTSPSFATSLEAVCFIQQLRLILMHYGICDGEMHNGQLRVDANVSLSQGEQMGVRTEVKNMNSMRHLHTAVNYEIDRQFGILSSGGVVSNETRACDTQGRTVSMRDKEEETDYRIIPEPNLPTLKVQPDWISSCLNDVQSSLPQYQRFIQHGFDARTAIHYAEDPLLSRFVTNCDQSPSSLSDVSAVDFVRWLRELKQLMQRSKAVFPPQSLFFAHQFVSIVSLFTSGRLTKLRAIDALRTYANEAELRPAEEMFEEDSLWRITDDAAINRHVDDVIAKNQPVADKARAGNPKALSRLRNLVVEASQKRIEVETVENTLRDRISL